MDYQVELEETQRALREITLMIEQSQGELAKITSVIWQLWLIYSKSKNKAGHHLTK